MNVLKILGVVAGAAVTGYVVREVQKEYDATVDENMRLRKFIDDHDFYERQPTKKPAARPRGKVEKVDEFVDEMGRTVQVFEDKNTGFRILDMSKAKKDA